MSKIPDKGCYTFMKRIINLGLNIVILKFNRATLFVKREGTL